MLALSRENDPLHDLAKKGGEQPIFNAGIVYSVCNTDTSLVLSHSFPAFVGTCSSYMTKAGEEHENIAVLTYWWDKYAVLDDKWMPG